jgi:hypothetical protein
VLRCPLIVGMLHALTCPADELREHMPCTPVGCCPVITLRRVGGARHRPWTASKHLSQPQLRYLHLLNCCVAELRVGVVGIPRRGGDKG